jgi:hypothetical protein
MLERIPDKMPANLFSTLACDEVRELCRLVGTRFELKYSDGLAVKTNEYQLLPEGLERETIGAVSSISRTFMGLALPAQHGCHAWLVRRRGSEDHLTRNAMLSFAPSPNRANSAIR